MWANFYNYYTLKNFPSRDPTQDWYIFGDVMKNWDSHIANVESVGFKISAKKHAYLL